MSFLDALRSGRGELLEFVFGEDEAVEAVGGSVVTGEMLRLPQDETKAHRPLLLPQQARLVADREDLFQDRPFGKRLGETSVAAPEADPEVLERLHSGYGEGAGLARYDGTSFVTFTKEKNGIHVVAQIEGLTPGLHGFHIHEYGDCSSPDAGSAGGHFNPMGMPHAAPTVDKHHMGDLGNIEAPKTGPAKYDKVVDFMAMDGPNSIIGRGVIVHLDADDFKTQPTGGSGARAACGVIGISKP